MLDIFGAATWMLVQCLGTKTRKVWATLSIKVTFIPVQYDARSSSRYQAGRMVALFPECLTSDLAKNAKCNVVQTHLILA